MLQCDKVMIGSLLWLKEKKKHIKDKTRQQQTPFYISFIVFFKIIASA